MTSCVAEHHDSQVRSVQGACDPTPTEGMREASKGEADGEVRVTDSGTDTDRVDGFLLPEKGQYCPRDMEVETWGQPVGQFTGHLDQDEYIFRLLKTTAPETKWRHGLLSLLRMYFTEDTCRMAIDFLLSNGEEGMKATEKGFEEYVHIEDMVPRPISCPDWLAVMEGLNFDINSPMTVRDVKYIDVVVGKKTDIGALKGFCYLLDCLKGLSWSTIQGMLNLPTADGELLYATVEHLGSGCGIKESDRSRLDTVYCTHGHLMKQLGFRTGGHKNVLQWQNPRTDEFSRTLTVLNGLYRPTDRLETAI